VCGVSPELAHLWALHQLDEQVIQLQGALLKLPARRAEVEQLVAAERRLLEDVRARAAALQRERRQLESEAGALGEQERRFQIQLTAVKKNEEYQALLHEIGATKQKRSDLETDILIRLEEEGRLDAERPARERTLAAAEQQGRDTLERVAAEEAERRAALEALDGRRATELAGLEVAIRSRYERIRASREGRAVVPLVKGACGGCFRTQPPQMLQEARRGDRILTCDGCGRLLIQPPEAAATE
jgi:uncharacterized protein